MFVLLLFTLILSILKVSILCFRLVMLGLVDPSCKILTKRRVKHVACVCNSKVAIYIWIWNCLCFYYKGLGELGYGFFTFMLTFRINILF